MIFFAFSSLFFLFFLGKKVLQHVITPMLLKCQMDAKLPMDIFENVMQLATEGCKAVAQYIQEVRIAVLFSLWP